MTKISDMTPLTSLASGSYVPVEKTGSTTNYRYDLSNLPTSDGLFLDAATLSVPVGFNMVSTTGYATLGVGGANYIYDASVNSAYVTANPRTSFMSANGRGFRIDFEEGLIPQMLGAVTGGATDCRAIIAATDALGPFDLVAGDYLISSSITISNEVNFLPGARLIIPTGVTVTFSSEISAGIEQLFVCTGTGKVVFNWTKTSTGYMEWWGAKADLSVDCLAAWNAATLALLIVKGMGGDYQFSGTPKLLGQNRAFHGLCSPNYNSGTNEVTRFIVTGGTATLLQIGPDVSPGAINSFQQGNDVRDLYVTRSVAPVKGGGAIGVRMQYLLKATVERVKSQDSLVEFSLYGTVHCKVIDTQAARALVGTGGSADSWVGYHADGSAAIGAAGGNASLYLIRPSYSCNETGLTAGDSTGLKITGNFTDLFLDNPEGTSCRDDIVITGNAAAGLDSGNCDLRIDHPTSDAFTRYGISISNLAATGIVQIHRPYFGPNSAATASLNIASCAGTITVVGGEALHHSAPLVKPVNVSSSEGVQLLGLGVLECSTAAVTLADVKNCRIQPMLSNKVNTAGVAVAFSGANSANIVAPMVKGKTSAFTKGIDVAGIAVTFTAALTGATSATLTANWTKTTGAWTVLFSDGTTKAVTFTNGATTATWSGAVTATANATYLDDQRNEYNLTGIDSACIASGSGNKLVRQSVQIVATGLTGTNLVSGVVT